MSSDASEHGNGGIEVGGRRLSAVTERSADEVRVIGGATGYTVGETLEAPRGWIEAKGKELGFSEDELPDECTPKRAYNRANTRVLQGCPGATSVNRGKFGRNAVFSTKVNPNHWEWGFKSYDEERDEVDSETTLRVLYERDRDEEDRLRTQVISPKYEQETAELVDMIESEFEFQYNANTGPDLRNWLRGIIYEVPSVPLRNGGGVYFVPERHRERVQKAKKLIEGANSFKDTVGEKPAEVWYIDVIDEPERKELIQSRAGKKIREEVETVVDNLQDELEETKEKTVTEVVAELEQELGEATDVAQEYNALLGAKLSVEKELDQYKQEVDSRLSKAIEKV